MKELFRVESLWEYLEKIFLFKGELIDEQGSIPHIWFRGAACTEKNQWRLIPSLQRVIHASNEEEYFDKERGMNTDFQSRASVFLESRPDMDDHSGWLTLMQHYGFPTRLLDWSRSPLYAMYFATSDRNYDNHDGCIWLLNPGLLNKFAHLEEETYIYHMEHNLVKEVMYSAFKNYKKYERVKDKIVACYATRKDMRVFNQQSAFTVHNSLKTLEEMHDAIYETYKQNLLMKILIPAEYKKKIFSQLFESGITHSNVFPDIEHLAKDVKLLYGLH